MYLREQVEAPMRRRSNYSEDTKDRVLMRIKSNDSVTDVSRSFQLRESTVYRWIKEAGVENPGNRKVMRYSDDFRDNVIKFARSNTNFVTRQHFMIPDSTLRIWLKQAGLERKKINQEDPDEDDNDKVHAPATIIESTFRLPFSKEYRSKVLDHSKMHGLKEASEKFGVSMDDLKLWTRRAGKKFTRDIPDDSKRNIVEWGVKINSWKLAARKYNIHPSTVGLWARKFNLKLRPGGMETYHTDTAATSREKRKSDEGIERTEPMPRLSQQTIIRDDNSKTEPFQYFGDFFPGNSEIISTSCDEKTPYKKIKKEVWKVRQQKPFVWQPVIDEINKECFDDPSVGETDVPWLLDDPVPENSEMNDDKKASRNAGIRFCDSCQQHLEKGESLYEHFAIYHIV